MELKKNSSDASEPFGPMRDQETPSWAPTPVISSHRERDDAYPTICRVTDKIRVIGCKDALQWVIQYRKGENNWQGLSFCRTRKVLLRDVTRKITPKSEWPLRQIPPAALEILSALPEWYCHE
jgi:hypothetical protein